MSSNQEIHPLPRDLMPDAWFNDERMNSMFAEFRNRSVNPQDWDSKFKFWDSLLVNYLGYNAQVTFSVFQLSTIFKRKGRTPLCLSTVVEELYQKSEIITLDSFLEAQNATWGSWAVNTMVKRPMVWSFSKLKNYFIPNVSNPDIKYIHIPTIKELSEVILSLSNVEKDLILSVPEITNKCSEKTKSKNITEENVKLALLWLGRLKKGGLGVPHHHEKWECLLKISPMGVSNLSEAEEGLFKLKDSERLLLEKIESLEKERNALLVKAKGSLDSGLKELAKTYVRKKRELDKRIEKHAGTLHNLHTLISSIHDARSNNEVLEAYRKGRDILKGFEKSGLNEITARDTMDDMIEAVGEVHDVQSTLSENLKINDSDLELEQELNDLLNSSSNDKSFPNVPDAELPDLEKELHSLLLEDLMF
ncbi:charged multivesicular body protein 7 isoform X2 [Fopius arisanus]|uniref:Charged multivesicular body protein 7 isoform X2 n=1 Tax=Fopius arisanus TaxID=64838 RepID=A0A9R1U1G1_9HYME|nr:PREDICTED: charged multivesicular body protein 7 isoform X2 [Fopius arisanus]